MAVADKDAKGRKSQSIQTIDDSGFAKRYELGAEVMPSSNHGMEIKHAKRHSDQQSVVVKLRCKAHCFQSREEEQEWRRGAEFMLNLPHNVGVARIFEVLEDSRAFYIVMEKADGIDLFELILLAKGRSFNANAVREILYEVLQALTHLHEHNGIHRDLKLENIIIGASGLGPKSVKLIDFDTVAEWTPTNPPGIEVLGTDQYIAQEGYKGQYSPLTDVFAVGVIGYRLIVGRFPFQDEIFDDKPGENWVGSPKMEEISSKLKQQKVNFNYPVFNENPQVANLLSSMLQHNPHHRPTAKKALEHEWMADSSNKPSSSVVSLEDAWPLKARRIDFGLLGHAEVSCLPFLHHMIILPLISFFH